MNYTFDRYRVALKAGGQDYFAAGEGDIILYLHGAGGLTKSYPLYDLATDHRLLAPVHPGFDGAGFLPGLDSMAALADHMADFLNTEADGPAFVVAHSFGGWLACWLAVRHPQRVRRLVLECPAGFRSEGKGGMSEDPRELRASLFKYPEKAPPEDRARDVIRGNRYQPLHYHGGMPSDDALVARLPEIQAPTLLIYGVEDKMIPPETCEILSRGIPDFRLVEVEDAFHYVQIDQPDRFTELCRTFLADGPATV